MNQPPTETDSLAVLQEIRPLFAHGLNSLAGKKTQAEVSYLVWGAIHMNKIVAGYCELRRLNMIDASKIMIRPVIEVTFSVVAALNNPAFLFRKAYSEHLEDKKLASDQEELCRNLPESLGDAGERQRLLASRDPDRKAIDDAFAEFQEQFTRVHPGCPMKREKVTAKEAAQEAKLAPWYTRYRTYCQFTHGALQATSGSMDETTDQSDNLVMVWLSLIILDNLKKFAPVELPELGPLWAKADAFLV